MFPHILSDSDIIPCISKYKCLTKKILKLCLTYWIYGLLYLNAGHVFAFGESRPLAIANMVLGLKEIQIRGEIRTNVDYTIDLLHVSLRLKEVHNQLYSSVISLHYVRHFLQASDYRENKIHTGWLDSRIAMRVRAERPPWYLSVVGGALYVSYLFHDWWWFVKFLFGIYLQN